MAVRASVIVPVFNPGEALDALIASLDRQTLAPEEFEVLLCDDGSDDATHDRLDALERTRAYVRVLHLEHTGWPGTPRNHGIEEARGDYVYFVDQDDYLFDAALERMCDFADAHGSDVIIGKEVGVGRRMPRAIFRRDLPHAVLGEDPLLEILTPHKMFRTAFLRTHGIRFPDGRVRLEDHLFVMRAYFEAGTISVLASEPCYAWVKQPGSASSSRIDPETYFPHLETVLELVASYTEPGALRDRLLRHWFRGKILKRLSGKRMTRYPDDYRERFLDTVVPLVRTWFGPGVDEGLSYPHRIRAGLLRADRRADLVRLADLESAMRCRAEITSASWSRGGGLHLVIRTDIETPGIDSPQATTAELARSVPGLQGDADEIDILFRRSGGGKRLLARAIAPGLPTTTVAVDPLKAFPRGDTAQRGRLFARVRRSGWTFDVPLSGAPDILAAAGPSPILAGRSCGLESVEGAVELRRAWPTGRWRDAAGRAVRSVRRRLRRA